MWPPAWSWKPPKKQKSFCFFFLRQKKNPYSWAAAFVTITAMGAEAMPFTTTTSELAPVSMPDGRVKRVDDTKPGATERLKPNVRA